MNRATKIILLVTIVVSTYSVMALFAANLQYTYDNLNRLIRVEYDDGQVIEYTYDDVGNRIAHSVGVAAPVVSSFAIKNGAASTTTPNVTLNNTVTGGPPSQYLASESSSFVGASWQVYAMAPSFALSSGYGLKTVYFKVRNEAGTESTVASDSIKVIEPKPVVSSFGINSGASTTTSTAVSLDNTVTGSTPIRYMASETPDFAGATWKVYSTNPSFTLSSGFGKKTIYFKVKNSSGGKSAVVKDTISLVKPTPVVASFAINNGAETTAVRKVTLNNTVTDSTPTHYMASESESFTGAAWKTYSNAPVFTLSTGKGMKTVYFKVKNATGAKSTIVNDAIEFK